MEPKPVELKLRQLTQLGQSARYSLRLAMRGFTFPGERNPRDEMTKLTNEATALGASQTDINNALGIKPAEDQSTG